MHSPTSSSSSLKPWKYDVYLSFRGEDTRRNFTDHLYCALEDAGVNVFIDDQVRGASLENDLNQAIEGSKIAVIVFSENYAESRWCLDELAKIMECRRTLGQLVVPIHYYVNPSDVSIQTGTFATAFLKHEQRFHDVKEKLQLWRNALTEAAELSGFSFGNADRYEGRFIREIVTQITRVLNRSTFLAVASYQVGIDSRVQDIVDNYLDVGESNDVRRIGIWGMGGMGKTTLAKAIFNKYQDMFEGKSFLLNVRKMKLIELQERLLFDILKPANTRVSCVDEGIHEIKTRLCNQRVLVIVDDIDHMKQFEALAINYDSFGPGSRIIITTRDQHLLKILKVDRIYKLPAMNREEAFQLFSWHAFRKNCPNKEYLQVSRKVVDYCGGLPLALKVLGSYLFGRSTSEWKSALEKLKFHPHREILKSLKISFDELHDYELKAIFLDVSCFFTGMNKDFVMKILDGCDLYPEIGITVLQERCLVTVDHNLKLVMPDLLRDMGREIVRSESSEPGERSRLWHHDDVIDVLRNKSGTEAIRGLTLDLQESDKASFSAEAFRNMQSLRLLKLNYVNLTGSYDSLSNELRWLCWHGFPLEVIPKDFDHLNMVAIDLSYSKLIRVWEDSDLLLEKLKFLNLSHSHYLTQSPDFSKLPNLEQLILQDCKCLLHVDQSIGQLQKLVLVDLKDCKVLRDLPESFYKLTSVQTLDLAGCSKFENLAEDLGGMSSLTTLIADNTAMESIPTSIFRLLPLHGLKWPLSTNPLRPSLSGLRPDPGSTACQLMKMASSSSSSKCSKYDVFLSFGGETRKNLTDNLYCTLKDHRFNVFIDENELTRGEIITPALKQAVKDSRLAAIIFSSGYVESRWCLDELVEILACRRTMGQMVLPIFYNIDPSDVRHQRGAFAKAFREHQERFPKMVQSWKDALNEAAELASEDFSTTDGYKGRFVRKIVDEITRKLKNTYLAVAPNPVGIDSRVQEIGNHLDVEGLNDVRIIGILGMGGLGKTTVAKAIFNKYQGMFQCASFIPNVREDKKLVDSQNTLLSDVLRSGNIKVSIADEGTEDIKSRLGSLKALVIVDDVDSVDQLDALAIERDSFGPGSRIVITTRNEHLLRILNADWRYHLPAMNKEESLELLSWRAFSKNYPNEEYVQVSREVVEYCGGLPLALEVLGTYLREKSTSEWKSALGKWKRSRPYSAIHKRLKISYDGLTDDDVKSMFLDISCFFIGMNKEYVLKILDPDDWYASIGIRELFDQCLVAVDTEGNLMMHSLIRDTGREIVREKSPNILGKRCRLWDHEDVKRVLRTKTGSDEIQGLALDLSERHKPFSTEAFRAMQGLRLLKLEGVKFTGHCEHLSKELRWLCWPEFPVEVMPVDFNQTNLVDVDLSHSNIQVWEDSDVSLEKLKFLNLGYCKHLIRLPDFSKIPNLERLILEGCTILSEIHSVVRLINLKYLSLANCNLADHAIPQDLGALSSLEVLDARGNGFNCLPILSRLSKLQTLHLNNCTNLQEIPDLPTNLEILEADGCIALEKMPDFSEMSRMRELHLNHSPKLTEIPGLDKALNSLARIHMEGCTNLTAAFKKALQGWSASGNGGLFLPGNQSHKRLRSDPSVERIAEEESDEIMQEGSSMG